MKPVNLLPGSERPRVAAEVPKNASVAALGVLAVVLLAVAMLVLTKNDIADKRSKIAQAQSEQAEAAKQTSALKAFGDFRQIKDIRVSSVEQLATRRFDWERFMRELALVLPGDVWLTEATSSAGDASGTTPATATPSADPSATGDGGVSVKLTGCAKTQKSVAETMARLRNLHGANDVQLNESTKPNAASAGSSTAGAGASDGASGDAGGCGKRYTFAATIVFAAPTQADDKSDRKVPTRLGGGA